jgi:DNA-binding CsgD family transcriptional regulator
MQVSAMMQRETAGPSSTRELDEIALAAFLMGRSKRIEHANNAALRLGCAIGASLEDLPFEGRDNLRFADAITQMHRGLLGDETILLLQQKGQTRSLPVWMNRFGDSIIIMLTECNWPSALPVFLKRGYGLTQTEAAIAEGLCFGATVSELCQKRNRAMATIRSQIKSVLAKTGTRSQSDLIRLITCLASMIVSHEHAWRRFARE